MTFIPLSKSNNSVPLFSASVVAGFPSPADDYIEKGLSLDELLIPHPSSTYLVRAQGDSMKGCGIFNNDVLIVDRSLTAEHRDIVIAALDGELTCKFLDVLQQRLVSANPQFPPISIPESSDFVIEGVVSASIRFHKPCSLW